MNVSTSLCPGYRHVDVFGSDNDYEDEEVSYVTLDLGSIEPTLVPSSSTYRLIGLDSPTPFLQLSGTILKGRHDSLLGTELLFTDGKDPNDKTKRSLTHVATTEQRICFKEVRLQPKPKEKVMEDEDLVVVGNDEDDQMVDRVTGKAAPRTRAPRTRSSFSKARTTTKGKGKGKEKAGEVPEEEGANSTNDTAMDIYDE